MTAAQPCCRCSACPVQSAALNGLDSLLSIVQMPGGVPVAHAGHRQGRRHQRRPARRRASWRRRVPSCASELRAFRDGADRQGARGSLAVNRVILPGATIGVLGSGQLGRMMAIAARRMGYRVHTLSPGEDTPTGQVADLEITADYEDLDAMRAFAQGRGRRHVRVRERVDRSRGRRRRDRAGASERLRAARHAAARAREGVSRRSRLSGHAVRRGAHARRAGRRARAGSACRPSSRPPRSATTARASIGSTSIEDAERVWGLIGHQEAVVERVVDFAHEMSVVGARGLDGDVRPLRRD